MKRTICKSARGIWSETENGLLVELAQEKDQVSWNEIAQQLNEKCGGTKTGKQCRERYRNYANPRLEKTGWKPYEKLFFLILHQIHGNHWSNIAKYLHWRSDVVIKNYFYYAVRRVTKYLRTQVIPRTFIKAPEKFYVIYSLLKYMKEYYLPDVDNVHKLPKYSHKERMILNLLSERKITEESIITYQENLIRFFKESTVPNNLPVEVILPIDQFNIPSSKIKDLYEAETLYNTMPLKQFVVIKIIEKEEKEEAKSAIPLNNPTTVITPEQFPGNIGHSNRWSDQGNYPLYGQSQFVQAPVYPQGMVPEFVNYPQNNYYEERYYPVRFLEPTYARVMTPPIIATQFPNQQILAVRSRMPINYGIQGIPPDISPQFFY